MQFGVNGWVWTSPVNTQAFEELAPKVKNMGFESLELGSRAPAIWITRRRRRVAKDNGLAVSVCAAMGPDRDLIHADGEHPENGMEYVAAVSTPRRRLAPQMWWVRSTARSAERGSRPRMSANGIPSCSWSS